MKKKNILWLLPVLICIIASVASVFLPVLTYRYPTGQREVFNIVDFVEPSLEFVRILSSYDGPNEVYINKAWLTVLAVLAVLAIVAAFVGVITMSLQRPNTWQFVLALVGIIGTAIPALLIIIAAPVSQQYMPGTFQIGVYPIITPIAMVLCMITVTKKHRKTQAEIRAAEKAKGLIRRAGDL